MSILYGTSCETILALKRSLQTTNELNTNDDEDQDDNEDGEDPQDHNANNMNDTDENEEEQNDYEFDNNSSSNKKDIKGKPIRNIAI